MFFKVSFEGFRVFDSGIFSFLEQGFKFSTGKFSGFQGVFPWNQGITL
jgi:hypothetical protein